MRFDAGNPTWASQGQALESQHQENGPCPPGGEATVPRCNPGTGAVPQTGRGFFHGDLERMASRVLQNQPLLGAICHLACHLAPHCPFPPSFAPSERSPLLLCSSSAAPGGVASNPRPCWWAVPPPWETVWQVLNKPDAGRPPQDPASYPGVLTQEKGKLTAVCALPPQRPSPGPFHSQACTGRSAREHSQGLASGGSSSFPKP